MSTAGRLPQQFAELERFAADWCLATESERYAARVASAMPELEAFYDAFSPRLEEAIAYCNQFPLTALPEDALALLQLIYSLITVAMAVEVFQQPTAVNAADAWLRRVLEPVP